MIRSLRASVRLAGLVILVGCTFLAHRLGRLWALGNPAKLARVRARVFGGWARLTLKLLGVRLTVSGTPPARPFYLVTNHLGYFDIPLLASVMDGVFVAKAEVASWPVMGFLCKEFGTLFVDRSSRRDVLRVLEETRRALDAGEGVVLFPEGTSSGGDQVLPFLPSLLATPAQQGYPVHYGALSYSTRPPDAIASLAVCWWGEMTFPDHFWRLLGLSRIEARISFGERPIASDDRKELAARLQREVSTVFDPMVGSVER